MEAHEILLTALAFFSELLGTLSGFGSSTFFIPAAAMLEGFHLALALTAILHCFGNVFRVYLFRKGLDWKLMFQLATPAIIFTIVGALLVTSISQPELLKVLGVTLIIVSLSKLFFKNPPPQSRWVGVVLCSISGFLTGFVGTGGAVRGLALTAIQLSKSSFVMTSASIDLLGDIFRAGIYLNSGFFDFSHWFYIPLLGVAALTGALAGRQLLSRVSQEQFEKVVAIFILISGILMIFQI